MRIVIHAERDGPSRFGVLCHELAHVFLATRHGQRSLVAGPGEPLDVATVEIEAESVAYVVTTRFGLQGSSATYLSSFAKESAIPRSVSLDYIAKAASLIERMAKQQLKWPKFR
jgi:hypothetical protein